MKTTHQVLVEARELLSNPEHWAKEYYAYDSAGNLVAPDAPAACKWCSLGAISRASEGHTGVYVEARDVLERVAGTAVQWFNDDPDTHHEEILAMFDLGIGATK